MKKVLRLLKPHVGTLLLSILFITINTVMQLLIPYYTKDLQSQILHYDWDGIVSCSLKMLGFTLIGVVTSIANTYFSTKTSVGYTITLRNFIFGKVSELSQADIDKIGVASLVTRTTNDVRQLHDFILSTLKSLLPVPIMLVVGLIMAFSLNPQVAGLSLWIIPVLFAITGIMLAIIIPLYSKMQKLVDKLNQIMREKIGGIRVIRAFNRTKYEDDRFDATNRDLTGISLKAARFMAGLMPIVTVAMYALISLVIWVSIRHANELDPVLDKAVIEDTIPNLQAFIMYFSLIISSVVSVVGIVASIPRASISGRRVNAIIDAVSEILPPEQPVAPAPENVGCVEMRGVTFRYKPREENDDGKKKKKRKKKKQGEEEKKAEIPFGIEDISFVSRPGEVTAVIGVTGCGKTTLLNLIPRLYDVNEGEVLVNGVNVKDLDPAVIRDSIAVIPQQAYLFSGTVADNVRFGNENATDAEVWKALEIAQIKTFVSEMPEGIDSFVSQAGKNFSGGQKQRIAIARAIVKKAPIMLFDDSFSALDLATDARLRASLRESLGGTNMIIVAQRVGTVLNADRILVMEGGRIVGQGTHAELMKTCETYRELVVTQLSEEALEEVPSA